MKPEIGKDKFEDQTDDKGQFKKTLRNAVIAFAIIEALILIPIILYKILR
jgi:hypothetical protein